MMSRRGLLSVGLSLAAVAALAAAIVADDDGKKTRPTEPPDYETVSLRGRVVWLADALERRFGIETDADAQHAVVALETDEGQLYPLVKDNRGRGFHLDPRIQDVEMQLLVRRTKGSPFVQVIRVYTVKSDGLYELDYWCDICSIPMYELKPCECCQGETRLRERKVAAGADRAADDSE